MSTISITTSTSTVASINSAIAAAVGNDVVEFSAGTVSMQPGDVITLVGSASGSGTTVTYRPASGAVVTFQKNGLNKTDQLFHPSDTDAKRHNIVIDGRQGGSGTANSFVFDGGGILLTNASQFKCTNWEVKFCKMLNFYTGANNNNAAGRWWFNTVPIAGLKIHDNAFGPANNGQREAYGMILHMYPGDDNVQIYNNTADNMTEFVSPVNHVTTWTGAPVGFKFHHNTITGMFAAGTEFLGIPGNLSNPMFYFNSVSNWTNPSNVEGSWYGLSLVTNFAYGVQVFGNVIKGGSIKSSKTGLGVRTGIEDANYYSQVFANLLDGVQQCYVTDGGFGQNCYGNTMSNWQDTPIVNAANTQRTLDSTQTSVSGTGATAHAVVSGGLVTNVVLDSAGTNYKHSPDSTRGDAACPPKIILSGGGGSGALVYAWVDPSASFGIGGFIIMNQGTGYATAPTVTITRAGTSDPNRLVKTGNGDFPLEANNSTPPSVPTIVEQAAPTPTGNFVYLSDTANEWLTDPNTVNGSGPIELDQSNNTSAAGDGTTLKIGSSPRFMYTKGLGTAAPATIAIDLTRRSYTNFKCDVGIDAEVGLNIGSAQVVVRLGSKTAAPAFSSGLLVGGNQPIACNVSVIGFNIMYIQVVSTDGDTSNDHVDLGFARLETSQSPSNQTNRVTCVTTDEANKQVTLLFEDNTTQVFPTV